MSEQFYGEVSGGYKVYLKDSGTIVLRDSANNFVREFGSMSELDVWFKTYVIIGTPIPVTVPPPAPFITPPAPVIITGSWQIISDPPGATIYLDYVNTGFTTPHTFTGLTPGSHLAALSLTNYQTMSGTEVIISGQTITSVVTMVPTVPLGRIIVSSNPSGANIYLNLAMAGQVTPYTFALLPGEYYIEVKKDGYTTASKNITLVANQIVDTGVLTLVPVATTGPTTGPPPGPTTGPTTGPTSNYSWLIILVIVGIVLFTLVKGR